MVDFPNMYLNMPSPRRDYRQDIMMLLPPGTKHRTRGLSCQCDGCGRGILYGKPWNEYVLIYEGKVYSSRYCFNKKVKNADPELMIEINRDFNARNLRIGNKIKGIIDNR